MISLKEFIRRTNGKVVGFTDTSRLRGECVTLIQEYIRLCYGVPFRARGHAKAWINSCNDIATKTSKPQYGDIIVWDGTYGHVAIYIDGVYYYDQWQGRVARLSNNSVSANRKILGYLRLNGNRIPDEVITKYNLTRLIRKGSIGNDVKELQKRLRELNYNIGKYGVDGIAGNDTINAVKRFQRNNGLVADGIVGRNTAHKLGWTYLGK